MPFPPPSRLATCSEISVWTANRSSRGGPTGPTIEFAGLRVEELRSDPQPIALALDRSVNDKTDVKRIADSGRSDRYACFVLIGLRRVARDDLKLRESCEVGDDVLGKPFSPGGLFPRHLTHRGKAAPRPQASRRPKPRFLVGSAQPTRERCARNDQKLRRPDDDRIDNRLILLRAEAGGAADVPSKASGGTVNR